MGSKRGTRHALLLVMLGMLMVLGGRLQRLRQRRKRAGGERFRQSDRRRGYRD
ncbi:hypothetical protein ACFSL6_01910 [Paenibacillus thailandensis]|uniref:hypothetical protein n=1 Tax=Paenibacillus thailandensis TaxID=393250 RepID=UPI00363AB065